MPELDLILTYMRKLISYITALLVAIGILGYILNVYPLLLNPIGLFLDFRTILDGLMILLIGVEIISLFERFRPVTVIELLIVITARELLLRSTDTTQNLLGVAAIALLFGVRKYFVSAESHSYLLSPDTSIEDANRLAGCQLPNQWGQTLGELMHHLDTLYGTKEGQHKAYHLNNITLQVRNRHGEPRIRIEKSE